MLLLWIHQWGRHVGISSSVAFVGPFLSSQFLSILTLPSYFSKSLKILQNWKQTNKKIPNHTLVLQKNRLANFGLDWNVDGWEVWLCCCNHKRFLWLSLVLVFPDGSSFWNSSVGLSLFRAPYARLCPIGTCHSHRIYSRESRMVLYTSPTLHYTYSDEYRVRHVRRKYTYYAVFWPFFFFLCRWMMIALKILEKSRSDSERLPLFN